MGIGKRIKEARENAGFTQKELGEIIGVTSSAITNYENETSHPKEPILYALINALHVDANFLFQDCVNNFDTLFSLSEREHIKKYRALDKRGKEIVDTVLSAEYKYCQSSNNGRLAVARDGQRVEANTVDDLDSLLPPEDTSDI